VVEHTLQPRFVEIRDSAAGCIGLDIEPVNRLEFPWQIYEVDLEDMGFPNVEILLEVETVDAGSLLKAT
jgi:hypothetical protein